jgi:hypothetical protein
MAIDYSKQAYVPIIQHVRARDDFHAGQEPANATCTGRGIY